MKPSTRVVMLPVVCAGLTLLLATAQRSQGQQAVADYRHIFDKNEVMIPMRDGVRLHTEIYTPKSAKGPLPLLIERTPYGLKDDENGFSNMLGNYTEMFPDQYVFVFQDIRGRYGSEGKFVMNRPPRDPNDSRAIDEATDTYDTVDCS